MTQVIIKKMTRQEANQALQEIKKSVDDIEKLLLDFDEGLGWKALGYSSLKYCLTAEIPQLSYQHLQRKLQAGKTRQNIESPIGDSVPEGVLRPIATAKLLDKPEEQKAIWQEAVKASDNGQPTAKQVEQAKKDYQQYKPKPKIVTMNRVNENIEWAAWSWNPITGCLHNCPYCYARDIANRFYPQGFEPTYHPERLTAPDQTKIPKPRWANDIGYRGVFVCSMADLFGKWVPVEWIESVLETVKRNQQWTFLMLTKFPIRMAEFDYPSNVWLGTSVDRQHAVHRAQVAFEKIKASGFNGVCWLSCEPMLERLTFDSLNMFDWVVIGGASKSTQTPEHRPPFDDIVHLYEQARAAGCKIYMKPNLLGDRLREYPNG